MTPRARWNPGTWLLPVALGALGALAAGCGPKAKAPTPIGSVVTTGPGETRPDRRVMGVCEAIAAAVDAAPTFRSLAADPARHDASRDQPAKIAVEGAVVTVLLTEDDPDLTIAFPDAGRFEELRHVFVACPVFQDGDWTLDPRDAAELELPADSDRKVRFARPDNLLAWMKVMGAGELLIVIH